MNVIQHPGLFVCIEFSLERERKNAKKVDYCVFMRTRCRDQNQLRQLCVYARKPTFTFRTAYITTVSCILHENDFDQILLPEIVLVQATYTIFSKLFCTNLLKIS
jgi:hypothetical protein